MAQDPIVIVDAQGTEHEFPAGFDPTRAAAIVRGGASASPSVPPQTLGHAASEAWSVLNPINAVKGLAQIALHPIDSYHGAVDASAREFGKAGQDYQQGHYSEMIGHGAAAVLPGIGPAAADAGEQIASGDVAGGVGRGLALAASPAVYEGGTKLGGAALREAGIDTTLATLRPSKALKDDFGGGRTIAKTVLDERLPSARSAITREGEAAADTNASLQRIQAQGIGVPSNRVVQGLRPARDLAQQDVALGLPDGSDALRARAVGIHRSAGGQDIPVTTAQTLKQRAQDLAFEAKRANLSVPQAANQGIATALKEGIEEAGQRAGEPNIGALNARTQRVIGARRAWDDANLRSHTLSNLISGSVMTGGGLPGVAKGLAIRALDMPHVGAATGIGLNEAGRALASSAARRALLLAALEDEQQQGHPAPQGP